MMELRLRICTVFLAIIVALVVCQDTEKPAQSQLSENLEHVIKRQQASLGDVVNQFGYNLSLSMMRQEKDQNVVISPTSIAGLLGMTLLGTVGNTYNELAGALGFAQDVLENRKNHEQFGDLLLQLNSLGNGSKTLYADAMFLADGAGAAVRAMFREYLARVYGGDAVAVDFRQAAVTKDLINEWVLSHTQGKLENFLLAPLPEDTQVVLLSALYFSGQWLRPFLPEFTAKLKFKKADNETFCDQMLNMGVFDYVLSNEYGVEMIALPYNDSSTVLYALKPAHGAGASKNQTSLMDMMSRLDYFKIDQLISQMEKRKSIIRFPKMELQNKVKLDKALRSLGIRSLFSQREANFALMVDSNKQTNKTEVEIISRLGDDGDKDSQGLKVLLDGLPNPGLHVDSVLHDVRLTINEFGTEAVAATAGVLARSATLFYLNSPFYMFIRNERTKLVTFSALIFDPTT